MQIVKQYGNQCSYSWINHCIKTDKHRQPDRKTNRFRQTGGQTDRQTYKQTDDRQRGKQTDRQKNWLACRQTGIRTNIQPYRHQDKDNKPHKHATKQKERQTAWHSAIQSNKKTSARANRTTDQRTTKQFANQLRTAQPTQPPQPTHQPFNEPSNVWTASPLAYPDIIAQCKQSQTSGHSSKW